jgi:hypothetical protein
MKRLTTWLPALLIVGASGVASAQPAPSGPPAPRDDDDDGSARSGWDAVDRPLSRALAYERRDVVEEILRSPRTLSAASSIELAEDIGIAREHADRLVAAARSGASMESMESLLRAGVPEGVTVGSEVKLQRLTEAQLKSLGMSDVQAREFMRYRNSAKRVYQHFREVKAIAEARARGSAELASRGREFLRSSTAEKVRTLAAGLGLSAPEAELEARRLAGASEAELAERRARLLEGASAGGARDVLASFRRSDGTVKWSEVVKDQGFRGASGVAHFAFAMFLKEMVIVLRTGDRGRLEEFVDGLMSTDFFVNYGLFAAGASAADVAYGRFVRRVTRKQFLSGVLRSNLVLAAGLAVPMVARGQFELDTYLVDVAALGLSATAVKAAVEGGKGVYRLVRGGRGILSLGRWGGVVGWVFTAAEAAVVLLIADDLAARFDRFLDERALRKKVKEAQEQLERLSRRAREGGNVNEDEITATLRELEDAYDAMRRLKTRGLEGRLTEFRGELDSAGRRAHIDDTAVNGLRSALDRNPALRANVERRHGTVDNYLTHIENERNAPTEARLREEGERFDREWPVLLDEAYTGAPRGPSPTPPAEGSRLALYDEETSHLLAALDGTTDPEARRLIALAIERVRLGRTVDRAIYRAGSGAPVATAPTPAPATPAPVRPTTDDGEAREVGLDNALRRDMGLAPTGAGEPTAPVGGAAEADVTPVDALEYGDDGLPGALPPVMGPSFTATEAAPAEAPAVDADATPADALDYDDAGLPRAEPDRPAQGTLPSEEVAADALAYDDAGLPRAEPDRPAQGTLPSEEVPADALDYDDAGLPRAEPDRPAQGTLPSEEVPADALDYDDAGLPIERPAQGTVPAERPAQGTVPAERPAQGTVPAERPEQGTVPAERPAQQRMVDRPLGAPAGAR